MRPLSQREKNIVLVCASTFLVFMCYTFVYMPLTRDADQLARKIDAGERRLKKNIRSIKKSTVFGSEYEKFVSDFKQEGSEEEEMSSILSEIEEVARTIELRITDLKPKRVKNVDFYNTFSVSLAINGQLDEIMRFLYMLQNQPHMFNVDELRIERSSPRSPKLYCRIVLSRILIP